MDYSQHPVFTFGDEKISGFWLAKFEASVYDTSDACYKTSIADNCNKVALYPTIQPNRNSWRNITDIYDMSGGAYEYVSAYVNNGDAALTTNGQSIISAHNKYKDIYTKRSN